jgi:hypothetical protein
LGRPKHRYPAWLNAIELIAPLGDGGINKECSTSEEVRSQKSEIRSDGLTVVDKDSCPEKSTPTSDYA